MFLKGSLAFMQHFKFVNWRIGEFIFWCHGQVKCQRKTLRKRIGGNYELLETFVQSIIKKFGCLQKSTFIYRTIFTTPSIECRLTDLRPCSEYHIRIHALADAHQLRGGMYYLWLILTFFGPFFTFSTRKNLADANQICNCRRRRFVALVLF